MHSISDKVKGRSGVFAIPLINLRYDETPRFFLNARLAKERVTSITPQKGKRSSFGAIAQLGEHLLCKQGVVGSIPTSSTII